jgi:hypothetical protein
MAHDALTPMVQVIRIDPLPPQQSGVAAKVTFRRISDDPRVTGEQCWTISPEQTQRLAHLDISRPIPWAEIA